jgi:hypothetical protein
VIGSSRNRIQTQRFRFREGAYVLHLVKADNPNQPLSSLEKGRGICERMNVQNLELSVNGKFAGIGILAQAGKTLGGAAIWAGPGADRGPIPSPRGPWHGREGV